MLRLYLFAEGQTEQTFAGTVLGPHLSLHGVYVSPVLVAHCRRKGKVHRGGGGKYIPMRDDIRRFLAQEKSGDVFFTTMIDLYAIPKEFPGLAEAEKLSHLPYERVAALESAFASDIADRRFVPYLQLHEYEAYLFSDPTCFRHFYGQHDQQIAALQAIADAHESPELIDGGSHTAPSKRIIAELPDYDGAKSVVGPQVAEWIGLETIRRRCPHFNEWVQKLEQLGGVSA